MLGRDAGVDRDLLDHIGQIGVAQSVDSWPVKARSASREAQLAGDRHRRGRVIAGDHHWSDTRHLALSDRSLGFLAGWVDHADQTDEDQAFFLPDRLAIEVRVMAIGQCQDA